MTAGKPKSAYCFYARMNLLKDGSRFFFFYFYEFKPYPLEENMEKCYILWLSAQLTPTDFHGIHTTKTTTNFVMTILTTSLEVKKQHSTKAVPSYTLPGIRCHRRQTFINWLLHPQYYRKHFEPLPHTVLE